MGIDCSLFTAIWLEAIFDTEMKPTSELANFATFLWNERKYAKDVHYEFSRHFEVNDIEFEGDSALIRLTELIHFTSMVD